MGEYMTREALEYERAVLDNVRGALSAKASPKRHAALGASIERLDSLLSLTDEQVNGAAYALVRLADEFVLDAATRDAYTRVADLIRRDAPTGPIIEGARGLDGPGGTEP